MKDENGDLAIVKPKKYNLQGSYQIQAGSDTLWSQIHILVNSILRMEELPDQWKESIIAPMYKKGDKNQL
jgi:hypothetical protein